MSMEELSVPDRKKRLLTDQCREDVASMLVGFDELCRRWTVGGHSVVPAVINSDSAENNFEMVGKTVNGANQHPTSAQYGDAMTGVNILGAPMSGKGNASNRLTKAVPMTLQEESPRMTQVQEMLNKNMGNDEDKNVEDVEHIFNLQKVGISYLVMAWYFTPLVRLSVWTVGSTNNSRQISIYVNFPKKYYILTYPTPFNKY